MDRLDIEEREKEYLAAAKDLDDLEAEYASMWLVNRVSQKSDMAATHATTADLGPYWNELKAKRDIARLRLEKAYEGA